MEAVISALKFILKIDFLKSLLILSNPGLEVVISPLKFI